MRPMYGLFILMIVFHLSMGSSSEIFNLTLTMPYISKTMSNQSIYIAVKLPIDEEIFIVDFQPIYNRQKVHFITTYLCSKPYSTKDSFWFGYEPCYNTDQSMIIYEWYYNIPAVQWPKDTGFRVGMNTPYRYVVIHIQYFASIINDTFGQKVIISRIRPKYKVGTYQIVTNSLELQKNQADFSCRYHSSSMQIFSTRFYSDYEGRSVSLYRVRSNQLQLMIKGNLHWPQTFYQSRNSTDIQRNDYLIGTCVFENRPTTQIGYIIDDELCRITIMFSVKQDEEMQNELCWNNDFPRIVDRFLPNDVNMPPQTLFDINPTYPKLTPNEWAIANANIPSTSSESMDSNNENTLLLTYLTIDRRQEILRLARNHKLLVIFTIWGFAMLIGFVILFVIIFRSSKKRSHRSRNHTKSKAITVGGETSSLSGWLTKRRFQQYDQGDYHDEENQPLKGKHRWASASEESPLSDDEVFNSTDFQNIRVKN